MKFGICSYCPRNQIKQITINWDRLSLTKNLASPAKGAVTGIY